MMRSHKLIITGHIIGWLLFLGLIIGFLSQSPGEAPLPWVNLLPHAVLFFVIYLVLFYLNSYLLVPKIFLQKRVLLYAGVSIALLTGVMFIKPFEQMITHAQRHPPEPPPGNRANFNDQGPKKLHGRPQPAIDIVSTIAFLMVWAAGFAVTIIKQWRDTERRAVLAESERTRAELSFLKAQVNPHFLFNTLNNIYAMSVAQSPATPESILKLSNIMRYVTDEASQNFVPLQSEVDCATDYIDLQKLRLSSKVQLLYEVKGILAGKQVAPLLFITFIENVFKYGTSNHQPCTITIKILSDEKMITLQCENTIFHNQPTIERTGIGISNAKQRLEHLYPGKYLLDIKNENDLYNVNLVLLF